MLHNTLQLRASHMAPETRGAAMSAFAASFFFGQLAGVAIGGLIYDRFRRLAPDRGGRSRLLHRDAHLSGALAGAGPGMTTARAMRLARG
jgi:MFS family permease